MRSLYTRKKNPSKWFLIDCKKLNYFYKRPGRLATIIADLLRGRDDENYQINAMDGNYVVLENVNSLKLSGNKFNTPNYFSHSGFLGSQKIKTPKEVGYKVVIQKAVYGCLPKNKTRDKLDSKLRIFEEKSNITQKFSSFNKKIFEVENV